MLGRLREDADIEGGDTTGAISIRDLARQCEVSRPTIQLALRRLAAHNLVTPLSLDAGTQVGRRYRLAPEALTSAYEAHRRATRS